VKGRGFEQALVNHHEITRMKPVPGDHPSLQTIALPQVP
jgi:hypothetical protein